MTYDVSSLGGGLEMLTVADEDRDEDRDLIGSPSFAIYYRSRDIRSRDRRSNADVIRVGYLMITVADEIVQCQNNGRVIIWKPLLPPR